jgi:hypothetical protein
MENEANTILNACTPEKLPSLPLLNDAIQQLQKLEENLKKYLNESCTVATQPQFRNLLQTGIRFVNYDH